MIRTFAAGVVLAGILASGVTRAQQSPKTSVEPAFAEVDRLLTQFMTERHVPGAAWGVIVAGQLAHTGAKGLRDVDAKAPVDADSVFRIASMTKSFTAISIL